ncbi:hypothetical protein DPMN_185931 [Dreissena polymorpha]|uniref:Reverse transcriptase domain-containing protein n=1 Tax=Dreissena polymorpha TaxID=45954 RepID=A0A9D4I956_DREPO|nr:hypothetical protein DPMN_185931 [Dreissena polymorpha]
MEKQEVTVLIAIDLSAAFDTVDHNILLDDLNSQYGVSAIALNMVGLVYTTAKLPCQNRINDVSSTPATVFCTTTKLSWALVIFNIRRNALRCHSAAYFCVWIR